MYREPEQRHVTDRVHYCEVSEVNLESWRARGCGVRIKIASKGSHKGKVLSGQVRSGQVRSGQVGMDCVHT